MDNLDQQPELIRIKNKSGKIIFSLSADGIATVSPPTWIKTNLVKRYRANTESFLETKDGADLYQVLGPDDAVVMHVSEDGVVYTS